MTSYVVGGRVHATKMASNNTSMTRDEIERLFNQSQMEDILRDLRRNTSDAPEGVRGIVRQLLDHPYMDGTSRTRTAAAATAIQQPTTSFVPPAPAARTLGEELRSVYTPTRGRGRSRSRGPGATARQHQATVKVKKVKIVKKSVFLLSKGMTTIPTDKGDMRSNGRVADCVNVRSDATVEQILHLIDTLFSGKLQTITANPRFYFMKADRNKVYRPNIPKESTFDGETVCHLAGKGNIYLMANGVVEDAFDEKLYCLDQESSGDEDLVDTVAVHVNVDNDPFPDALPELTTRRRGPRPSHSMVLGVDGIPVGLVETAEDVVLINEEMPQRKAPRVDDQEVFISAAVILRTHVAGLLGEGTPARKMTVSRLRPFRSFIREWNEGNRTDSTPIEVRFFDSLQTVDDGGPRREFLYRLLKDITCEATGLFQATVCGLAITQNAEKLETQQYYWAGRAVSTTIVQGGPSVALFTSSVYSFLAYGYDQAVPIKDDVPSEMLRQFIEKLESTTTQADLTALITAVDPITLEDGASILITAGIASNPRIENVPAIIRRLIKFYVLGRYRSELEDFARGMKHSALLELIQEHPSAFKELLVPGDVPPLTGADIVGMFTPIFSDTQQAKKREEEEEIAEFWVAYMGKVDRGEMLAKPADVMRFASAVEEVPVLGWGANRAPTLVFDHEATHKYPGSSTCGPTIVLRIRNYVDQKDFNDHIEESIMGSPSILGT